MNAVERPENLLDPGLCLTLRPMYYPAFYEMYRDAIISTETWDNLAEHYDTHQLMSIVMTVARYRKVSMTLNALGVQPLPEDERFPVLEGY